MKSSGQKGTILMAEAFCSAGALHWCWTSLDVLFAKVVPRQNCWSRGNGRQPPTHGHRTFLPWSRQQSLLPTKTGQLLP